MKKTRYKKTLEKCLDLIITSIIIGENADELHGKGKTRKDAAYYLRRLKKIR